jgi:cysteine desulfurase
MHSTRPPVYFDHHATTPVDEHVYAAMMPYFCGEFGNAGSTHCFGRKVRPACDQARKQVANLVGTDRQSDIVFTSGATESNNMAIKGVAFGHAHIGRHIITTNIEHQSVLATCRYLETIGYDVTYVPCDEFGQVSAQAIERQMRHGAAGTRERTVLISVMGANNEIGTINPVREISELAREHGVFFHVDGAQMVGKIPFSVREIAADLVSLSAHKIYGPKGIGALYVNSARTDMTLTPLVHGGGQEFGLRSGTMPVGLVVGLGAACEIAQTKVKSDQGKLQLLVDEMWSVLKAGEVAFELNGHPSDRLPGNMNICVKNIESELLDLCFKDIAVSSTSACSAAKRAPSHVLKAIGRSDDEALSSVRFGFGRSNTIEEVRSAADRIVASYRKFAGPPVMLGMSSQVSRSFAT